MDDKIPLVIGRALGYLIVAIFAGSLIVLLRGLLGLLF